MISTAATTVGPPGPVWEEGQTSGLGKLKDAARTRLEFGGVWLETCNNRSRSIFSHNIMEL